MYVKKIAIQVLISSILLLNPIIIMGATKNISWLPLKNTDLQVSKNAIVKKKVLTKYPIKNPDIVIKINGMVCSFCAQGIQKQFNKHPAVKAVVVQLENISVYIKLKPFRLLPKKEIKRVIQEAGYEVGDIQYL
jgi:copper chaperone CopZ